MVGLITVGLLGMTFGWQAAIAQADYPVFEDAYVNDYGEVLAAADERDVRAKLETFRTETGVHASLLTIHSVQDYPPHVEIEPFATDVFNLWGLGDATRNDGILLILAPGDRKVRLELGAGYSRRDDAIAQAIIDDDMLPHFRASNIGVGTVAGVDALIQRFDPTSIARSPTLAARAARWSHWLNPFTILPALTALFMEHLAIAVAGAGALLLPSLVAFNRWQRYRDRFCPDCQTAMTRLDETADDQYLKPGQRKEESLGSVDYDVWLCQRCGHHTTLDYAGLTSRYRKCSKCRNQTLRVKSRTLTAATYTSTGTAEVTERCEFCDFDRTYQRIIPVKERPSSSSRSSSSSSSSGSHGGGGRSSGGGASGSW
jgi:uncharacterized protein